MAGLSACSLRLLHRTSEASGYGLASQLIPPPDKPMLRLETTAQPTSQQTHMHTLTLGTACMYNYAHKFVADLSWMDIHTFGGGGGDRGGMQESMC